MSEAKLLYKNPGNKLPDLPCTLLICLEMPNCFHNLKTKKQIREELQKVLSAFRGSAARLCLFLGPWEHWDGLLTRLSLGSIFSPRCALMPIFGKLKNSICLLLEEFCVQGSSQPKVVGWSHLYSDSPLNTGPWRECPWPQSEQDRLSELHRERVFASILRNKLRTREG